MKKIKYPQIKRLFDILISLILLVIFSPLFILFFLKSLFKRKQSFLFYQSRIGKNYKSFNCYKFQTMKSNSYELLDELFEKDPAIKKTYIENFKLKNDPRITRIGKVLRKTSLDEIPQLINILRGEMSLIGPRPIVSEEIKKYGIHMNKVISIRPGLTGLWQVSGRNNISYKKRILLDRYYVKNYNFWLDFKIFLRTIIIIAIPINNGSY